MPMRRAWRWLLTATLAFASLAATSGADTNAPTILAQPKGGSALAGASFCFDVLPGGAAPFGYQWYFQGSTGSGNTATQALAGATSLRLVRTNLKAANDGSYWVVVTNNFGSVTSALATLTVADPVFTRQPVGGTAVGGHGFTFSVQVAGTEPIAYQWLTNGSKLAGATSRELTLSHITRADALDYSVIVSNAISTNRSATATLTVADPLITNQPVAQAVNQGTNVTFSVEADGNAPFSYQWFFNDNPQAGKTGSSLFLPSVTVTQSGTYSVTVSNQGGVLRSSNVTLTVYALALLAQPLNATNDFGGTTNFSVEARGAEPLAYQWFFQAAPSGSPTNLLAGETNASLTLTSLSGTNRGSYWVRVSNPVGHTNSERAGLKVNDPLLVQAPKAMEVNLNESASLTVGVQGSAPLSYQWFFNGSALASATNAVLPLPNITLAQAGNYAVQVTNAFGSVRSPDVKVTVYDLAILRQPVRGFVVGGQTFTNSVEARGAAPLGYQWYRRGVALPGKTDPAIVIAAATTNDSGAYHVVVSNSVRSLSSSKPTLTVLDPVILQQPKGRMVLAGRDFTFSVEAGGHAPFTYQWYFGGTSLAGQTAATLVLTNLTSAQAGSYSVKVSNPVGSLMSDSAGLAVVGLAITRHPAGTHLPAGTNAAFDVLVEGAGTLSFEWLKDGAVISNATQSVLTLTNLTGSHAGSYSVRVSNGATNLTSSAATLTVDDPAIIVQPRGGYATVGEDFSLDALAAGDQPITYQWYFAGAALAGQVCPRLTLTEVTSDRSGSYWVEVRNVHGTQRSSNAVVVVSSLISRRVFTGDYAAGALSLSFLGSGQEHAVAFSITYDTNVLANPSFLLPVSGLASGASLTVTNDPAAGGIGIALALPEGVTFPRAVSEPLGNLTFDVVGTNDLAGMIDFGDSPVETAAADLDGNGLWLIGQLLPSLTVLDDPPVPHPQSGLLRQRVRLSNPTAYDSSYALVGVYSLGDDSRTNAVHLFNAQSWQLSDPEWDGSSTTPTYYVQVPLARGESRELLLEFYASDQDAGFPINYLRNFGGLSLTVSGNTTNAPAPVCRYLNGELALEFMTQAGATYYVQYAGSLDGPWTTVFPAVVGTGSRIQWIDFGPPQTVSPPSSCGVRFYRIQGVR